jgi:hypothetical protein
MSKPRFGDLLGGILRDIPYLGHWEFSSFSSAWIESSAYVRDPTMYSVYVASITWQTRLPGGQLTVDTKQFLHESETCQKMAW